MKVKLAALRVNAGLTQEQVAKEMHVDKATVGKWERYESRMSYDRFLKLCELYHCTVDDVFMPSELSKEKKP